MGAQLRRVVAAHAVPRARLEKTVHMPPPCKLDGALVGEEVLPRLTIEAFVREVGIERGAMRTARLGRSRHRQGHRTTGRRIELAKREGLCARRVEPSDGGYQRAAATGEHRPVDRCHKSPVALFEGVDRRAEGAPHRFRRPAHFYRLAIRRDGVDHEPRCRERATRRGKAVLVRHEGVVLRPRHPSMKGGGGWIVYRTKGTLETCLVLSREPNGRMKLPAGRQRTEIRCGRSCGCHTGKAEAKGRKRRRSEAVSGPC